MKKNVIFTPPTRNAHFGSVPDGSGEEETLYIRSSMEEEEEEEEDEVFLKRVWGSRVYPPAPPDK